MDLPSTKIILYCCICRTGLAGQYAWRAHYSKAFTLLYHKDNLFTEDGHGKLFGQLLSERLSGRFHSSCRRVDVRRLLVEWLLSEWQLLECLYQIPPVRVAAVWEPQSEGVCRSGCCQSQYQQWNCTIPQYSSSIQLKTALNDTTVRLPKTNPQPCRANAEIKTQIPRDLIQKPKNQPRWKISADPEVESRERSQINDHPLHSDIHQSQQTRMHGRKSFPSRYYVHEQCWDHCSSRQCSGEPTAHIALVIALSTGWVQSTDQLWQG